MDYGEVYKNLVNQPTFVWKDIHFKIIIQGAKWIYIIYFKVHAHFLNMIVVFIKYLKLFQTPAHLIDKKLFSCLEWMEEVNDVSFHHLIGGNQIILSSLHAP